MYRIHMYSQICIVKKSFTTSVTMKLFVLFLGTRNYEHFKSAQIALGYIYLNRVLVCRVGIKIKVPLTGLCV